jgi:hypothetical protein
MALRFGDYRHVVRLLVLFAIGIAAFLALRAALMPAGFGTLGHYRAGALDDVRAQPVRFAGQQACAECHDDVAAVRATGSHARVACESCHGPLAAHAAAPTEVAAIKPDPRSTCLGCHTSNRSKPARFPQIVVMEHAESGACSECHQPHKPGLS